MRQRISVDDTSGEIRGKAEAYGMTVSELVRQAVAQFDPALEDWQACIEQRLSQIEELIERTG